MTASDDDAEPAPPALTLLARGHSIAEGPAWDRGAQTLYYCDGLTGGIWAVPPSGEPAVAIPKRRASGLALHERGGLVVSGRNVGWKHGERSARLLDLDPAWEMAYFNDLGTSVEGRVYVGSVDYDFSQPEKVNPPGYLHVIDLDGSSRIVADDIGTANGVGVSPDGRELYCNDTARGLVRRYALRPDGDLRERDPLVEFSAPGDRPDGLAVAADGSVLVALTGSHCVAVVGADGAERQRLPVPDHDVTSVCFGGPTLEVLFITTVRTTPDGAMDGSVFANARPDDRHAGPGRPGCAARAGRRRARVTTPRSSKDVHHALRRQDGPRDGRGIRDRPSGRARHGR